MFEEGVDVSDLPEGLLLATLYNFSKVQGMGALAARPGLLTEDEADQILTSNRALDPNRKDKRVYFDYLYGKIMKLWIGGARLDTRLYDRDLGHGVGVAAVHAARQALARRQKQDKMVDF